ncbi:phage tail sheath family protein [Spirilliplanes yamanashiensis]|uniref:Tail protein n=1 Tax=Spirilliplanes yamanashiensis TaxID=42233 RepID=A0A8J3Y9I0_9ACTN|nr:phage tail sheath family protein [Spirilliplanes yamanashiensis]MDP9815428.1 phage tail sheath protein FI [Spirilliplanes yamanashiensis]GIJ03683.1 tail protein [Spirilliplanes yamanashiensis]
MASSYLSPGVYVEEVSSGSRPIEAAGTAVAAFVGFAEKGPANQPTLVTNWTQYTQAFGGFIPGSYLAHAVYGYFANGGGSAYVVRVGGEQAAEAPVLRAELPAAAEDNRAAFAVRALPAANGGAPITVEVQPAEDESFNLVVKRGGAPAEIFEGLTVKRGPANVVTAVKTRSKLIEVEETSHRSLAVPRQGEVALTTAEPPAIRVAPDDYVGNAADRTGFAGLEAIDEITMLSVPDVMAARERGLIDDEGVRAVQLAMITHCELMRDRVAILDTPPGLNAQQVKNWRAEANYDSKYAALYYPWVKIMDPLSGAPMFAPPSGHMAGIWARNDATRGVHKAPANEVVRGAISLEINLTKGEHDQLNPDGVNCIRSFPGQGIRVWGARTLSSDPEWRYLNVRRLFNYVEKSILNGTNWVVFEPNDPKLWDSVKRTITMFLRRVWRDGALFGQTPAQAFFVKCDAENNPAENRDAGMLTVEIGIAPVKPAEFVIFRISQFADGAGLEE